MMPRAVTLESKPNLVVKLEREEGSTQYDQIAIKESEQLKISFKRMVRVSDNGDSSLLPPDLGNFLLYSVSAYQKTLSNNMAAKGGLFFPMFQREAMWIKFEGSGRFIVKIYAGGINVVSGEPAIEGIKSKRRRVERHESKRFVQDYVVTPKKHWLDGFVAVDGCVRQFVAMPVGSGYSVEAQLTGSDCLGGLQFEITPAQRIFATIRGMSNNPNVIEIFVKDLCGKYNAIKVHKDDTIDNVKECLYRTLGTAPDQQRLIYNGKQLEDGWKLSDYNVGNGSSIDLVLRLRGGGWIVHEMSVAAGGLIKQVIMPDKSTKESWNADRTVCFNVQILNSQAFRTVTGFDAPSTPVSAQTYADAGQPYFSIYGEEHSGIVGLFEGLQSVNQMDKKSKNEIARAAVTEVDVSTQNPIIALNPEGARRPFRHVSDLP